MENENGKSNNGASQIPAWWLAVPAAEKAVIRDVISSIRGLKSSRSGPVGVVVFLFGLVTTQLRKVLNDVSEKINGDSLNVLSVEDYFRDWLNGIEARNTASTHERYKNAVKWFLEKLQGKAKKPISSVTPQDMENYLTWRLKSGVANKTAIVDIKILKIAFRRAEIHGTILKNPVAAVRLPKENSSEREVFTHEEIQKILNARPLTLVAY